MKDTYNRKVNNYTFKESNYHFVSFVSRLNAGPLKNWLRLEHFSNKQQTFYIVEWMSCGFTSFSIVFQSYQNVGRVILKSRVQWKSR